MKVSLDWANYPDITAIDIIFRTPPESLTRVPFLYERATSSLYMLAMSGGEKALKYGVSAEIHFTAHIRAALADFVGIEDVMREAGFGFRIMKTTSPLLHFMRLLRNYQIHVGTQPISTVQVEFSYHDHNYGMESGVIDNLDVDAFLNLKSIARDKPYSRDDMQRMIDMFDEQQRRAGLYELLQRGIRMLIDEAERALSASPRH